MEGGGKRSATPLLPRNFCGVPPALVPSEEVPSDPVEWPVQ